MFMKEKIEYCASMEPDVLQDHEHERAHAQPQPETGANQQSVGGEIMTTVNAAVGRLSSELASVFAQEMQLMEKRQQHFGSRQDEMQSTLKDMYHTRQELQGRLPKWCRVGSSSSSSGASTHRGSKKTLRRERHKGQALRVEPSCTVDNGVGGGGRAAPNE